MKVGELPMRPLPALSATMPMYDVLHLFKIGRCHMALLKEATHGAAAPPAARPCFWRQPLPIVAALPSPLQMCFLHLIASARHQSLRDIKACGSVHGIKMCASG